MSNPEFTTKIVTGVGREWLRPANEVYRNNDGVFLVYNNVHFGCSEGVVYVMNQNGKTVATYHLSDISC